MPYPNNKTGVRRMLKAESDLDGRTLAMAKVQPDPQVPGCWLVRCPGGAPAFLAYLGTHPLADSWEQVE